ncbi:MAG: hypothetical protein AAB597_03560 [Patescibacteria group bacterium]
MIFARGKKHLSSLFPKGNAGVPGVKRDIQDATSFSALTPEEAEAARKALGLPVLDEEPAILVPDDHINDGSTPGAQAMLKKE